MNILPVINHEFNGTIWRMEIDELSDTIFLEIRNTEEKLTLFAAISLADGTVYFENLVTPERWLCGIEAAYDGVLLLHYYKTETGPTHKGLLAIDATTGQSLWSNFNLAFDHLLIDGPVLYDARIQPRKLLVADIKNGATISTLQASANRELISDIIVPQIVNTTYLTEKGILLEAYGNIAHYLQYNNLIIVSLHAFNNGALTQWLYIFNGTGLVYEDLLNADIQKIQPEAFIVHRHRLIYITNKLVLKVLPI